MSGGQVLRRPIGGGGPVADFLTVRDYFAASVLPAAYECHVMRAEGFADQWRAQVAAEAYRLADEMMKAREA